MHVCVHTEDYLACYLFLWGYIHTGADEYYISHVFAELDAPNEFFLDRKQSKLYYYHNATATATAPPATGFVATGHATLLSLNGSLSAPVRDVSIDGVGFRDARATYM